MSALLAFWYAYRWLRPGNKLSRAASGDLSRSASRVDGRASPVGGDPLPTPGVFTSTGPAWNSTNLIRLSEKITSPLVFAHVRAASIGSPVTEANCHPFCIGPYLFMHNGFLAEFPRLRLRMLNFMTPTVFTCVVGTSDSEHIFGVFMSLLEKRASITVRQSADTIMSVMVETIELLSQWLSEAGVTDPSLLNFALTDGVSVIVTRVVLSGDEDTVGASLYFSCGSAWAESDVEKGVYRMIQCDRREHVVIVASERLSPVTEDWLEVPDNHVLQINASMNVLLYPIQHLIAKRKCPGTAVPVLHATEIATTPRVGGVPFVGVDSPAHGL